MRPETMQKRNIYSRAHWLLTVILVLTTAFVGGLLSWQVSKTVHGTSGSPLGDLLPSFGPAALFASGRGMILPVHGVPPELEAFLNGRTTRFDPALLPADFSGPPIFGSYADTFPLTHWLLFYSVGWTWRLLGIDYAALHVLAGMLGAFAALSLYLLFRLGMNRLFACAGALFTLLLPPFLLLMPSLRDFSKAPFILLFIAVAFRILHRRQSPAGFLMRILCLALVLGAGYGFRQDILICLPVAFVLLPTAPLRGGYRPFVRAGAALLLLALFGLCALPVLRGMRHESGSVTTHTIFQGLSREAEQAMSFGDASYDLLLTPSDPETHAVINAHARMRGDTEPMSLYLSPAYARAGRLLFKEWARTFPADLFARGLASIETVQQLTGLTLKSPAYTQTGAALSDWRLFAWHTPYAKFMEPWGPLFVLAALFLVGLHSRRMLLAVLIILGYFMAYPSLLFQVRHAFHLAFVVPWALLFLLHALFRTTSRRVSHTEADQALPEGATPVSMARAFAETAGVLLLTAAACASLLIALRQVQAAQVRHLAASYGHTSRIPLDTTTETEGGYQVYQPVRPLPGLEESWNLPLGDAATSYIVLSLKPAEYAFPIKILYEPQRGAYLTREIILPASPGVEGDVLYFIPVYELADYTPTEFLLTKHRFSNTPLANLLVHSAGTNKFSGIGLRPDMAPLYNGMYYVENHDALPWLLFKRLTRNPDDFKACKRFGWEKSALMLPVEYRYWKSGSAAKAVEAYFQLLSRYPGHRPYADRIKTLIPRLPDPVARADALFRLSGYELHTGGAYAVELATIAAELAASGDLAQAERLYRQAVALAPDDLWHQTHLADTLLAQGNAHAAAELYAGVLKAAPESPYSATQFDTACARNGMADYQVQFWETLRRDFPQAITPALHLAQRYEIIERQDEALVLYEDILKNHEDHPKTLIHYGALVALKTEYAQGRALMDKGVKLDPELGPVFIEELCRLAENYTRDGNDTFAKAIYWETASLSPADPHRLVQHADQLAGNDEPEAAAEQYNLVLKTMPESPYSAQKLGELLASMGSPEESIQVWEKLHELHPAAVIPALYLAREYEKAGRQEEALALYERILVNHPEHEEALARKRALETPGTNPPAPSN
jgi:tetratricopeptide (TPR) repeat protein